MMMAKCLSLSNWYLYLQCEQLEAGFFLTFSVRLYKVFNEFVYSRKKRSAIFSSNITLNETLYKFGAPLHLSL